MSCRRAASDVDLARYAAEILTAMASFRPRLLRCPSLVVVISLVPVCIGANAFSADTPAAPPTPVQVAADAPAANIGVVDIDRVLAQAAIGRTALAAVRSLEDERVGQGKKMNDAIAALEAELNSGGATLEPARRKELQQKIADSRAALLRFAAQSDNDIAVARTKSLAALDAKVLPVIATLAREAGMSAVFRKTDSGLLFVADTIDLTARVIERLDEMFPSPGNAAAAGSGPAN